MDPEIEAVVRNLEAVIAELEEIGDVDELVQRRAHYESKLTRLLQYPQIYDLEPTPNVKDWGIPIDQRVRRQRLQEKYMQERKQTLAQKGAITINDVRNEQAFISQIYDHRNQLTPPKVIASSKSIIQQLSDRTKQSIATNVNMNNATAQNLVNAVHEAGVNSSTAVFWIIAASRSHSYNFSLSTLIDRWLEEVTGPLAYINNLAKTQYPDITRQTMFYSIRVMYYLLFRVYKVEDIDTITVAGAQIACPYNIEANNFILSLITTNQCHCLCYTSFLIAAAEEYNYTNVYPANNSTLAKSNPELPDHIYPMVVTSAGDPIMIVEAGFENNFYLLINYVGTNPLLDHYLRSMVAQLHYVTIRTDLNYLYDLTIRRSIWNRVINQLHFLDAKLSSSADDLLLLIFVTFSSLGLYRLSNPFAETIINYLHASAINPPGELELIAGRRSAPASDFIIWARALSEMGQAYADFIPVSRTIWMALFPQRVREHLVRYEHTLPIKVEPIMSVTLFAEFVVLPYFYYRFFVFSDPGDNTEEGSAVVRKYQSTVSSGLRIGVTPQAYGIPTGDHGLTFQELTPGVKNKIDTAVNVILELVQDGRYTTIYYPGTADGLFTAAPYSELGLPVRQYITTQLKRIH